ncbi:hypothetical protein [Chromobacterium violaceum]|uniref:hypothetical protein n=1 Tax=Chromobacterium violaceum TaxID=536 RepID=UPI000A8607E2|nr:hypothetical protein [Chromobacterium violaceum]
MKKRVSEKEFSLNRIPVSRYLLFVLFDIFLYFIYRVCINPSGLLESDDLFYYDLAVETINAGYSPLIHLYDLNRAIVTIIQFLFELCSWSDPSVFVIPGVFVYWFAAFKLFKDSARINIIILFVLLFYPDLMYVRYHIFKDIILVSLIALFFHYYENRQILIALLAAFLCAFFRFYLFPLAVACIVLLDLRKFKAWHFMVVGIFVFAFMSTVDIFSIVSSSVSKETFASGGDYTVKRVAESLGISNPLLLMPLVLLSFFLQPSPASIFPSDLDQIVPYSFLVTYFFLIPVIFFSFRKRKYLFEANPKTTKLILIFSILYVGTFAFDPVLADMRHRAILILPLLMLYYRAKMEDAKSRVCAHDVIKS